MYRDRDVYSTYMYIYIYIYGQYPLPDSVGVVLVVVEEAAPGPDCAGVVFCSLFVIFDVLYCVLVVVYCYHYQFHVHYYYYYKAWGLRRPALRTSGPLRTPGRGRRRT